jgi:hypothetical protein
MRYLAHANLTILVRHERVLIKVSLAPSLFLPASNLIFFVMPLSYPLNPSPPKHFHPLFCLRSLFPALQDLVLCVVLRRCVRMCESLRACLCMGRRGAGCLRTITLRTCLE